MKILVEGTKNIEIPKIIICDNCDSKLEYVKEDVIQTSETRYDPRDREPYEVKKSVVICPVCKNYIKI